MIDSQVQTNAYVAQQVAHSLGKEFLGSNSLLGVATKIEYFMEPIIPAGMA